MPKTDEGLYIQALQISYDVALERIDELERQINGYLELKEKHRRMEKQYKDLQVEHSRMLFDMDAVIEHEVEVKCKKLTAKLEKENQKLNEECKRMETRIDVMQELIDYNEGILQNALRMMEVDDNDGAFRYLEECYTIGDESMYVAMEKADEEDSDL